MDAEDRSSTSMNISLPRSLRAFVEERVAASSYTSASEYVRELIRKDQERQAAQQRLTELILEGLNSGPPTELTEADWAALRERATRRRDDPASGS